MKFKGCFLFVVFFAVTGFTQIQLVAPPEPGFEQRIRQFVNDIRIIDTHEHLITEEERLAMADRLDFTYLFSHYAKEDLISASNDKGIIEIIFGQGFPLKDRWQLFEPYYNAMRSTAYGRFPMIAARDIYQIDDINENTIEELSQKIREATKPGLYRHILKDMANIELSIQDQGHRKLDKEFYRHAERFGEFFWLTSPADFEKIGNRYGVQIHQLTDVKTALRNAFLQAEGYGIVAVKSGMAYNRILKYENVPDDAAEMIFAKLMDSNVSASPQEIQSFQDYIMHRILDLTDEFGLPFQVHTGLQAGNGNIITNSNPTHLANLFMEYPNVDFCIFHGSYPYGGELSTLAKNFPNVYIDMCWTHIISPSYAKRYLHEWIETVPSNKILAFGGDFSVVECVYAHSVMARKIVADVLVEKVESGYLLEQEAIDIASRILRENALEVFHLQGKSRSIENSSAFDKPGRLKDWWELHNTTDGFIRDWQVVGPFETGTGLDQVYPPEKELVFENTYKGLGGNVSWKPITTAENGYLNFISVYNSDSRYAGSAMIGMVYACAVIISPDDRTVTLTLGSNDGAKVWLNDEVIYTFTGGRNAIADQDFLDIQLKKGKNILLAKVENQGASWGFYARLVEPEKELKIAKP